MYDHILRHRGTGGMFLGALRHRGHILEASGASGAWRLHRGHYLGAFFGGIGSIGGVIMDTFILAASPAALLAASGVYPWPSISSQGNYFVVPVKNSRLYLVLGGSS